MNKNNQVRLRYAPSPTGKLHIGGARTALFNYLYAKNQKGLFIVRIEDTDIIRNLKDGESEQINNLIWLGVQPDIYPNSTKDLKEFEFLRQSERYDIYDKYIDFLLKEKLAYKCYCTSEELEIERDKQKNNGIAAPKYNRKCLHNPVLNSNITPLIRIKMPDNVDFSWKDAVRGSVSFNSIEIEDWVIRKSNGIPTYNFANVIDDHLMKITHVMRGEEHISNTPKQIHLYSLFNWEIPEFIHLTIITGENNKKLSKRDETVIQFISDYRERGYLSEAIFNFLSLLGWSPEGEEEIFTKEKLISLFSLERLSKAPSKFDIKKLQWTNNYYLQKLDDNQTFLFLEKFLPLEIKNIYDLISQHKIINLYKAQLHEGVELQELTKIFLKPSILTINDYDFLKEVDLENLLKTLKQLSTLENWTKEEVKQKIQQISQILNLKGKQLFMPIRLIITGQAHGPDLMEIITILGPKEVIKRIDEFK